MVVLDARNTYEYETTKRPIDILAGSSRLREGIMSGDDLDEMEAQWEEENMAFKRDIRQQFLIYGD